MLSYALQLVATLASFPQGGLRPRVEFRNNEFVVSLAGKSERVPVKAPENPTSPFWPPEPLLFRKDEAYVVWDVRGLTIRQKDWVYHTWLSSVPTSPRLFSREEILETKEMLKNGERQMNASTLSGAYRDGNEVFLLARWEDKADKPWAEAFFKVDLTEEKPKPRLLGRFEGMSLNLRPGKSAVFPRAGNPSAWVKNEDSWGLGSFDTQAEIFEFKRVGERLEDVGLVNDRTGWFVELNAAPSRILYRWDTTSLAKRQLLESPGKIRLVNKTDPWIVEVELEGQTFLQNVSTGARIQLPPDPGYRATGFGVIVWTPAEKPRSAVLFDPARWAPRAYWPRRPAPRAASSASASSLP